jgi:hypothetical protein
MNRASISAERDHRVAICEPNPYRKQGTYKS